MNKLNVALVLLALSMAVFYVQANDNDQGGLVNELVDDEDGEPDGGLGNIGKKVKDVFGGTDVLEFGVGPLNEQRKPKCSDAKSQKACETCCGDQGLAATTSRSKAFFVRCTCQERHNV